MKDQVKTNELSESSKKVYDALTKEGFIPTENSTIAFMYEEHDDSGYILFNFTFTGIYFKRSELSVSELRNDGIHVWAEWFCNKL